MKLLPKLKLVEIFSGDHNDFWGLFILCSKGKLNFSTREKKAKIVCFTHIFCRRKIDLSKLN